MLKNKYFWYALMAGSIVLYALSMALGRYLFPGDPFLSRIFFLGLMVTHIIEIPLFSLKIGREKQIPMSMIIMKTILYGFTWWVPLKMGIIER
jgi:hypothetical protein